MQDEYFLKKQNLFLRCEQFFNEAVRFLNTTLKKFLKKNKTKPSLIEEVFFMKEKR